MTAVRVVVEDSPVQRAHLREVLEADRDIAVIGQAGGPVEAVALVQRLRPDGLAVPALVVQQLHSQLVDGFVGWMQRVSALPVVVAADGDRPQPRVVYIGVDGMPGAARRLGAAAEVAGLGQLHGAIRNAVARLVRP